MSARTRTALAMAGAAAVAGLVAPGAQAAEVTHETHGTAAGWPEGRSQVTTRGLVSGGVDFSRGNRHQVMLRTTDSSASGQIRSWYCPSGAGASATWVSSRCTLRATWTILESRTDDDRTDADIHWVSSTGGSATQRGELAMADGDTMRGTFISTTAYADGRARGHLSAPSGGSVSSPLTGTSAVITTR